MNFNKIHILLTLKCLTKKHQKVISLLTLNLTVLEAGISIDFPVCGFTPLRALRSVTLKVPKPTRPPVPKPPKIPGNGN